MVTQRHGRRQAGAAAAVAALVVAAALSAAGCAEDGAAAVDSKPDEAAAARTTAPHSASAAAELHRAASVLVDTGTSRTRTSMVMTSGGTRVSIDGKGAFDYRRRVGRLTVRLPEGASGARAGERRPVTEIVVPGAVYLKNRGAGVPADKWVRVATDSVADGNLVTSGATDPVTAAELLRGARMVTYEGMAEVDGERVRHYRGTVDLRMAAEKASSRRREQLAAAAKGFSRGRVPFDAYVDGEGRLRKIRHRFTFTGASASGSRSGGGSGDEGGSGSEGKGTAVLSTTWLYDFGARVTVAKPEGDDIYTGKIASS